MISFQTIAPLELIVKATVFLLSNSKFQAASEPSHNGDHSHSLTGDQPGIDGSAKKSGSSMAALGAKFKYLKEALAEETKRREEVELQAVEHAKRRAELESAIEENQRSQEMFRKLLDESQQQAQDEKTERADNYTARDQASFGGTRKLCGGQIVSSQESTGGGDKTPRSDRTAGCRKCESPK
jgi:hypothetical protein